MERYVLYSCFCVFASRRRHTRCALVTGVQTCALPIFVRAADQPARLLHVLPGLLRGQGLADGLPGEVVEVRLQHVLGCGDQRQIGRASCRERVCQYVWISVVAVSLKKTTKTIETPQDNANDKSSNIILSYKQ